MIVYGSPRLKEQFVQRGVDHYIDYKNENYWEILSDVDYVIDTIGPKELSIMKPGGKIVSLINAPNKYFAEKNDFSMFKKTLFTIAGRKFDKRAK